MTLTAGIALYGAGVASASLGWQVYREIRRRKPELRVTGSLIYFVESLEAAADIVAEQSDGDWTGIPWRLQADVTNHGEKPVQLLDLSFRQQSGKGARVWIATGSRTILEPGRREEYFITHGDIEDFDPRDPVSAVARLVTGERFSSGIFGANTQVATYVTMPLEPVKELLTGRRAFVMEITYPSDEHAEGT